MTKKILPVTEKELNKVVGGVSPILAAKEATAAGTVMVSSNFIIRKKVPKKPRPLT